MKEDYVSYEVAKLLKEKGFDGDGGDCECHMFYCEYTEERIMPICEIGLVSDYEEVFFAPTNQMAMKWLRKIYGIDIVIEVSDPSAKDRKYYCVIWKNYDSYILDLFDSYEEAVEAALKYSLENLI